MPARSVVMSVLLATAVAAPAYALDPLPTPVPTPQLPGLPVPTPTVLPVAVPTVPSVALPTVEPPQAPGAGAVPLPLGGGGGGTGGGTGAGAGGGSGTAGGGGTSAGSRGTGGSSPGGGPRSTSGGGAGGGAATAGGAGGGAAMAGGSGARGPGGAVPARGSGAAQGGARSAGGPPEDRQARIRRRERRLRDAVRRADGCLARLPHAEREVLILRAGVGVRPPSSRRRVARRLHVAVRRIARLERSGLRRLRALARHGGCPVTAGPPAFPGPGAPPTAASGSERPLAAVLRSPIGPAVARVLGKGGGEGTGGMGVPSGGKGSAGGGRAPSSTNAARGGVAGEAVIHPPSAGGGDAAKLTLPLVVLVMLVLGYGVGRLSRREDAAWR